MIVFVTGSSGNFCCDLVDQLGFIGRKVVQSLLEKRPDLQIYLLGRKIPKHNDHPNIHYIKGTIPLVSHKQPR